MPRRRLIALTSGSQATASTREDASEVGHALHLNPHRAHELERVALCYDAGAHAVVEHHGAVFDVVFEVDVGGAGSHFVGDLCEGEVVRGGEADRASGHQAADDGGGADAAVVGVGAAEDFV